MTEVMMEKERSEATLAVPDEFDAVDEQLVEQLTDRARSQGLELTGAGPGSPDEPRAGDGAHPPPPRCGSTPGGEPALCAPEPAAWTEREQGCDLAIQVPVAGVESAFVSVYDVIDG